MSNVKYGVTIKGSTGKRERAVFDNRTGERSTATRSMALRRASDFLDEHEPRIVKITTRPKGWQPASSPPPEGQMVMVYVEGSGIFLQSDRDGNTWRKPLSRNPIQGSVTHWRHLPKPPKGGQ